MLLDHPATSVLTSATGATAPVVPGSVAAAAATALPSTVDIKVPLAQGEAEGSGVILTADGDVLPNNHVVAGATGPITVTLADGTEHQATVVGTSPSYDPAVIKVQGVSGLTPTTLGSSSDLQVGQDVVAIGSPQGLTGTVTSGIVSAFNRTVEVQASNGSTVVYNGLQTDAPDQPRQLRRAAGRPAGPRRRYRPRDRHRRRPEQWPERAGRQHRPGLRHPHRPGQACGPGADDLRHRHQTRARGGGQRRRHGCDHRLGGGGSPTADAGLAAGDVVTKVDNAAVDTFADLIARIGSHAPGDQVTLTVMHGGAARTVQVTLGSTPDTAASTSSGGQTSNPFGNGN